MVWQIKMLPGNDTPRMRDLVGCIAYNDQGMVHKFIFQEKWDKVKVALTWFVEHLLGESQGMPWKAFQLKVGLLIHIKPYLHGFFLVENAWQTG